MGDRSLPDPADPHRHLVIWVVATLTFLLFFKAVPPIDVARLLAGKAARPAQLPAIARTHGLDQPWYTQYWHYLWRLLHGDLGYSYYSQEPVTTIIKQGLPATLSLVIGGVLLWLIVGPQRRDPQRDPAAQPLRPDRDHGRAGRHVGAGVRPRPAADPDRVPAASQHGIHLDHDRLQPDLAGLAAWVGAHDPAVDHAGASCRPRSTPGCPAGRCSTRWARTTSAPRGPRA